MLNIGDKVRIRQDLLAGEMYGDCEYDEDMLQYQGKVATVTKVFDSKVIRPCYYLDIDNGDWYWDVTMLENVKEMFNHPVRVISEDTVTHTVNKKLEEESVRLAKAVCEYEEIVHSLEKELNNMLENKNIYKAMYQEMLDRHTNLKDEYNALVSEYNALVDEYNSLI